MKLIKYIIDGDDRTKNLISIHNGTPDYYELSICIPFLIKPKYLMIRYFNIKGNRLIKYLIGKK